MRMRSTLVPALALALVLGACGGSTGKPSASAPYPTTSTSRPSPRVVPASELRAAATAEQQFTFDLYRRLADPTENAAFSPLSIMTVLGMIDAGARGETSAQIAKALHTDVLGHDRHAAVGALVRTLLARNRDGVTLSQTDQAWVQRGVTLLPQYLATLSNAYGAGTAPLTGAAAINAWAADATHGRITHLFDDGDIANAVLVLTNAVYLEAKWDEAFKTADTAPADFTTPRGVVQVPTMHGTRKVMHAAGVGWRAIALPYKGGHLEMDVIVPDDLAAFERTFDAAQLQSIANAMQQTELRVALPRFEMKDERTLNDALEAMGIRDAFGAADLSGMTGSRGLFVSLVKHVAFVHVDEQGTVAAAVTGGVVATSLPGTFAVDRPFVYVVRDRDSGAVLFAGHVVEPR